MSRILLGWELGLNFGHLARLLPLAEGLRTRGHSVLAAVRDIPSAATVLSSAHIPFVQAPFLAQEIPLPHKFASYADILLSQGWANCSVLGCLVQGWLNLFQSYQPDLLVLDYSPTARLATRIAGIPTVLVGNGFELPPTTTPFPGFSWATKEMAMESERIARENACAVMQSFGVSGLESLRDILTANIVYHATFAELDHYGPRQDMSYIGPLMGGAGKEQIIWPEGPGTRVYAYLRPDTADVSAILGGIVASGASVVCFAPKFSAVQLSQFANPRMRFSTKLVDLTPLVSTANVCVSNGNEGTVAKFLLAGVPQLLAPQYVEAQLTARCVETMGAGLTLRGKQTAQGVSMMLDQVVRNSHYKQRAQNFAYKYRHFDSKKVVEALIDQLESIAAGRGGEPDMAANSQKIMTTQNNEVFSVQ